MLSPIRKYLFERNKKISALLSLFLVMCDGVRAVPGWIYAKHVLFYFSLGKETHFNH